MRYGWVECIRMLLVSGGMGHGVNIGLGKIGHASPVKWDNARLPCTAHHLIALYLASHSSLYHSKSAHQLTD